MLLIINADDLGVSKEVNDITFKLMDEGRITSATLMANAPNVKEAVAESKHFPYCSFGAHLNITDFSPISHKNELHTILNASGNFIGEENFKKIEIDSQLAEAIYEEFCAQIDALLSWGVKISHIDTHHHIHTMFKLFFIIKRIQKKYNIKKIRISRNIYAPGYNLSKLLFTKKKLYNILLRSYFASKTTDGFGNVVNFYMQAKCGTLRYNSVEAMIHPGKQGSRKDQVELLRSDWQKKIPFKIQLINYNQL